MARYVKFSDEQVVREAEMLVLKRATFKVVANTFGIGQSTLGYHMLKRLPDINFELYKEVYKVVALNLQGCNLLNVWIRRKIEAGRRQS